MKLPSHENERESEGRNVSMENFTSQSEEKSSTRETISNSEKSPRKAKEISLKDTSDSQILSPRSWRQDNNSKPLSSRSSGAKGTTTDAEGESQESGDIKKIETPRTKLKNDLKKLAEEISADFEDSEMETADEVEGPLLAQPALIKFEETIKAFLDKTNEERENREKDEGKITVEEEISSDYKSSEHSELKITKLAVENKTSAVIPALEGLTGLKTPSLPSVDSDAKSVPVSKPPKNISFGFQFLLF